MSSSLPPLEGAQGPSGDAQDPDRAEGTTVTRGALKFTDGTTVRRNSPRLERSLRSTGVLWDMLLRKDVDDFRLQYGIVVPDEAARMRHEAHENMRLNNMRLVLEARDEQLRRGGQPKGGRAGAISAPPLLGNGDEAPLTPAQMAQREAQRLMDAQEAKRIAAKLAMEKRIAEADEAQRLTRDLAENQAAEQERVDREFAKRARQQRREIEEARMVAQAFRVQREKQKEMEEHAGYAVARAAEIERQRKDVLVEQKRRQMVRDMRARGAAAKVKRAEKIERLQNMASLEQENADVVALEKEAAIAEKHKRLALHLAEEQRRMKKANAAKMREQRKLRQQKMLEQKQILEEKKSESLAHFEEVERRLVEKKAKIEEQKKLRLEEARLKELGREEAIAQKEHSMLVAQEHLEEKRAAKEQANAKKNRRQRIEQRRITEEKRLRFAERVDQVARLRRMREYTDFIKEEDYDEKNERSMMLLETKKNLNETCSRSAYEFSVENQKAQKKRQIGIETPFATIPDYGLWNRTEPVGLGSAAGIQRMGIGGSI